MPPSMMNMLPATEKGSRFVGICMHMRTPVVPCMYASPWMMRQPCGNNLSRAYCSRSYFVGWSQASPHTRTDVHVCQTCRRPVHSALLHPSAARHMPAPTLIACPCHGADSGPKVSFSLCLAWRSTFQCGGLHLSCVMQNSHCQPKKKLRMGFCYVGSGGAQLGGISFQFNVVLISWYVLVLSHFILFYLADHAKHP